MTDTHDAVRLADSMLECVDDSPWLTCNVAKMNLKAAAALLRRIPELEAELEAAKLGEAMHDRQATEYAQRVAHWIGKFDEVKAERDRLSAELEKVRVPKGWKLFALPSDWTPGPNVFKDWCSQWFGPDADDDYLMRAAHALLSLAATPTPPAQQGEKA